MSESTKVDDLGLDSRMTLEVIKQKLLVKLLEHAGGQIDLTPAEITEKPTKQIDMTSTQVGEGDPMLTFRLAPLVKHQG